MKLKYYISHRGNTNGASEDNENDPCYIENAIKFNLFVEIDIWKIKDEFYLGHDAPKYKINLFFLEKYKNFLFLHSKNHNAFEFFYKSGFETFWHSLDDFCLTSKGKIWSKPGGCKILDRIEVQLTYSDDISMSDLSGICSDEILLYRERLNIR